MSVNRIASRVVVDELLISAPGAAVRLDSAVPDHRPLAGPRRRRHPADDRRHEDEDTVTLHQPDGSDEDEGPDPVEALRRGGFRKPA